MSALVDFRLSRAQLVQWLWMLGTLLLFGVGMIYLEHLDANEEHRNSMRLLFVVQVVGASLALALHQRRQRSFDELTARHHQSLQASESRLAAIFNAAPDAILISDKDGTITRVNNQVEKLLGLTATELLGQSIEVLVPPVVRARHPELRKLFSKSPGYRRMGRGFTTQVLRKDGSTCEVEISLSRIETDEGPSFASALRDVTERNKAQETIKTLALFDQLTGLANRTLMTDRLRQAKQASGRSGTFGALLFIDLDNFKVINDTSGHDVGDQLLKQVGAHLKACVRQGDTVARTGGDEFVVILSGLSTHLHEAATATQSIAHKMLAALDHEFLIDHGTHHCSASIGATLFFGEAVAADQLLRQADLALYHSKGNGRNTFSFFDPAMAHAVSERYLLMEDMRAALKLGQFILHYQAQVTSGGLVLGVEVLLRWHHPVRGMVSPAEFIPLAEDTGLILPIGNWVLRTACTQLALWSAQPALANLTIAVNVSSKQFNQANFVQEVIGILNETCANPQRLKLELTESVLVYNVNNITVKMNELKAVGIGFSLDDFGTGYSSLQYLKLLPLDQLKIDASFVRDILTEPNDAAIAEAVVSLGRSLRLNVIAEGVETEEQRNILEDIGCHTYQGYFFSRPLPVDEFEGFAVEFNQDFLDVMR